MSIGEDKRYDLILWDRCVGDPYWIYDLGVVGDNINLQFKLDFFSDTDNISVYLYDDLFNQLAGYDVIREGDRLLTYIQDGDLINISTSDDDEIGFVLYDFLDSNYTIGVRSEDPLTFPMADYRFISQRIVTNLTFNSSLIKYFKVLVNDGTIRFSDLIYNGNVENLVFTENDKFNYTQYSDSFRTVKIYVTDDNSNGEEYIELEETIYMPACSVYHTNKSTGTATQGSVPQALGLLGTTYNTMCFSLNIFNNFWDEFYFDVCQFGKWVYFMVVIVIGIGIGMAFSKFAPGLAIGSSFIVMGMFLVFGRYVFPYTKTNQIVSLLVFAIGVAGFVTSLFVGGGGSSGDVDG